MEAMESDVRLSTRFREIKDELENYDVFISHRGPDTKTGFVGYLYSRLKGVGLWPFLDCKVIVKGQDAWTCIEHAIKMTSIALVVFTENFAESKWCLDELHVMLNTPGMEVLPIFYKVQPCDVRYPEHGPFASAFDKLRRRHDEIVINQWKEDLERVSIMNGWEHIGVDQSLEIFLVEDIVSTVLKFANKSLPLDVGKYVFGVKEVAIEIIQKLDDKKEVVMLGLWGMGGIGKSTLAKELYKCLRKRFVAVCYVTNVKDIVAQNNGVTKVQNKMLLDLGPKDVKKITNSSMGRVTLEEVLCKKRILLVLDDISDNYDLSSLISRKMLGEGSLCIITCRNKRVFNVFMDNEVLIHDVQGLSSGHSIQVLASYAFGGLQKIIPGFEDLVVSTSQACGGIPLVLKVCGALLRDEVDVDVLREMLKKLNNGFVMDGGKIFECLRISFDALQEEHQDMFLDITFAFLGKPRDLAIRAWKSHGWHAELGMQTLVENALVVVDKNGCLCMNDHLRDMGREIAKRRERARGVRRLEMPKSTNFSEEDMEESNPMSAAFNGMDEASQANQAYGMLDKKHKVFLSYAETERDFVEQLYWDLLRVHHSALFFDKDDESLPKVEPFFESMFGAANHCELVIVVISPEYFIRKWPMLELGAFVEAKKRRPELKILPIYYKLSVEEFRQQRLWFENNWIENGLVSKVGVEVWKVALKVISQSNGLEYDKRVGEVGLRDRIVEVVDEQVKPMLIWDDSHVQGKFQMQEMIQKMIQPSRNGMEEVLMESTICLGLFGVGGSGKTTMCKVLCNQMMSQYGGKVCLIEFGGVDFLQTRMKLLQRICQLESSLLQTIDEGEALTLLEMNIPMQKVCLIMDNVSDNPSSIGEAKILLNLPFKLGSLIVVTSQSLNVLEALKIRKELLMKIPSLTREEAMALLSHHAKCDTCSLTEEQMKAMEIFLERCNFNPLTLEILGNRLVGIHPSEWTSPSLEDVFLELEYDLEMLYPHLLPLNTSFGVGGPSCVNFGPENTERSDENLDFSAFAWASIGLDGLDSSDFSEVGNAVAMLKLISCLEHGEECVRVAQRISSHEFNSKQCNYLASKLEMVVQSARLYFNVLQGDLGSFEDVAKVVEVFKFLLALAKQVKSFVQGCCKGSWIQGAMTLTNVGEYVASVGFNLELCRVAFCMECAATGCLTLDEIEEIHKVEIEEVKKKAFIDVDDLLKKIVQEGPSLSNENKDLAFYLLQRLNQVKPIPGAILKSSEGNTSYDGGWFRRLYEWVKPSGQLGKGASGTVDKAMWLNTPVAKKTFYGKENPDFKAEVEALSPLSHPNVMSIFCSGMSQRGCCSIIMELMDEDLSKLMERRLEEKSSPSDDICRSPFPILEAVDIMLQIGEGGKYLHDQGIAHRDLKSMNILAKNLSGEDLDGYVHVKVADFGLSKTKEKSTRYSTMSCNVGTSRWMAPEIIRLYGSDQGSSSRIEGPKLPFKRDIYSFGMVCLEILSGDIPFASVHNDKDVKRQVLEGKRPEIREDPRKCPPLLGELIESCWSPSPRDCPTFIAICSALKYLKYLLMRSYCLGETIKKVEQSRLDCADISDSMRQLSIKRKITSPHEDDDAKATGIS